MILYITFQKENIIPTNMCYDEMNVSIQKLWEIGVSTLSKMSKTLNAHNFLNIYRNIPKYTDLIFKKILDGFARNLHEVGLTFRDDRNEG